MNTQPNDQLEQEIADMLEATLREFMVATRPLPEDLRFHLVHVYADTLARGMREAVQSVRQTPLSVLTP